MLQTHGGPHDNGTDTHHEEPRGRSRVPTTQLQLPKNRSTGNLAVVNDQTGRGRMRFSFDSSSVAEGEPMPPRSSIVTDHDHGLGLSGLRRIRQQPSSRAPTIPSSSNPASRSSSIGLSRSTSMTTLMANAPGMSFSSHPSSPNFSEDLSRFPSESLHSFSFAHQSEEYIHNRQNVLKRSIEFMKDRMGWSVSSSDVALASAQARAAGDVETQNMLDLLARAQLVGAGNLPTNDQALIGPLTGPAQVSGENLFEANFIPRTSSPEPFHSPCESPTTTQPKPFFPAREESPQKKQEEKSKQTSGDAESESSSRTPTNESGTTTKTSPPPSRRLSLKRTLTDTLPVSVHQQLIETMAQPYLAAHEALASPTTAHPLSAGHMPSALGPAVHGHSTRWVPAAQAIFTTESKPPWTIIAANDLACLVFGVTKAEVRKMGILEVVQEERRAWLEKKLLQMEPEESLNHEAEDVPVPSPPPASSTSLLGGRGGITAQLLSKPNSRSQPPKTVQRKAQTVHSGDPNPPKLRGSSRHQSSRSRGVLLCGDVVPIQKRNGATGSASLWVKEKRVGLIWVLEEIHEDVANIELDDEGIVQKISGATAPIWGYESLRPGVDVGKLIPRIPRQGIDPRTGEVDFAQIARRKFFTCPNPAKVNIPCTVEQVRGKTELRVSSFPHIAGIIVVDPENLKIQSSNSVFCGALFGFEKPDGMPIDSLIPNFQKILHILTEEDGVELQDGIVVPEHSFRRASAILGLRENRPDAAATFLRPDGLPGKHRDGSELKIDVQMRVVRSAKQSTVIQETVIEDEDEDKGGDQQDDTFAITHSEVVFALWITYSRHMHASRSTLGVTSASASGTTTPLHQPSPGQTPAHTPLEISSDSDEPKSKEPSTASAITKQLKEVAMTAAAKLTGAHRSTEKKQQEKPSVPQVVEPSHKKTIDDFQIIEDMGQGAYGQVKLAKYKTTQKKVVLKYVTKRRILVDTWTRDRKLGTVPLEIHVLDYLRRPDLKHPNIVDMEDFFEDDVNYYIEMAPHGLPGMDLFDYIELRSNMEEAECRSMFVQVAKAIGHLHTKALVVHRDIKDENVILDGEGNIKLIDFGSAAYIKNGPFDVFVGTIDYAAPEVLAGKPYGGKEQDVWALGILLYTIIYKENPFYSIDEIMDRDLRVPWTMSDESIDLVRCMLNRDVQARYDINQVLAHPWCQEVDAE
ncbi:Serine/threonine-protein kinase PSK1 [Colletotrichum gloeosporioides]|uniref:non-specific serine/threonine protein kinase n=1 Tax=Colletotrichum gloeosporioides TaxID=474922 RepID=A0A8H4CI14_COLGL|nr:Serine/threonine-protein kinase PSK1 [Colletotrichum gloeosporioides]KAF3804112.1 Serine/threonine-protein kinase PSK1 [Colletotrichum gloeosporioides]